MVRMVRPCSRMMAGVVAAVLCPAVVDAAAVGVVALLHPWPAPLPRCLVMIRYTGIRCCRSRTHFMITKSIHVVQNGRTVVVFRAVASARAQFGRFFLLKTIPLLILISELINKIQITCRSRMDIEFLQRRVHFFPANMERHNRL